MEIFLQQVINGVTVGCLYALVALGYSMVYGVLKMVNFAHGELFMLGPMFSLFVLQAMGLVTGRLNSIAGNPTLATMIGLMALCFLVGSAFAAVIGLAMERVV